MNVNYFKSFTIVASNDINKATLLSQTRVRYWDIWYRHQPHNVPDASCIGAVYKLVELKGEPRIKLSQEMSKLMSRHPQGESSPSRVGIAYQRHWSCGNMYTNDSLPCDGTISNHSTQHNTSIWRAIVWFCALVVAQLADPGYQLKCHAEVQFWWGMLDEGTSNNDVGNGLEVEQWVYHGIGMAQARLPYTTAISWINSL